VIDQYVYINIPTFGRKDILSNAMFLFQIFTMFVFLMEVSYGTNYEKQGAYFRLLGIELKEMFINNPDLVDCK
jgi:hypothetical protein